MGSGEGVQVGDGLAVGPDLVGAAEVATGQALAALGVVPDLVVFFVCPGAGAAAPVEEVEAAGLRVMELAAPGATIGTTAHGVMADGRGVEGEPAVAVWAASLPGTRVRAIFPVAERRSGAGPDGRDAIGVRGLVPPAEDDRVAVLLADPFAFPVSGVLDRLASTNPGFPVIGGLASGPGGPGANRLFAGGTVHHGGAVGVLLGGASGARVVVSQGCRPIGPPMVVTRAEQNRIAELAGRPAAERLREIVTALPPEEQQQALTGLHLGVAVDEYAESHDRGDFLVRAVLAVDVGDGAVIAGDVVEIGTTVRFQVRDAAGAAQDLHELLAPVRRAAPAAGALLFSCNGRGAGMFGDADHDVHAVRVGLDPHAGGSGDAPGPRVAGFFAAGEIGPVGPGNHLHAFTASVLVV
ncbi:FIST N-terminal domain-containing protein [Pseudonocardia sp. McavD-2-B]|uniref:FIST signal transduction protein n=1 Tax=Pseudonocardia sp. McavD-2-B TaxID=2954499 RepID=UPI0020969831|nr:FIST N-terminal domain-containing protein [Pseudonocardia sp. McavD-2-B]MCO7194984.1 FIST C-terminal domain-containing protein [Pseudonocardia sp. McavD-2-B]